MKLTEKFVEDCARMALGGSTDTILLEQLVRSEQPEVRQHLDDFIIMAESQNLSITQVADRAAAFVYACARLG